MFFYNGKKVNNVEGVVIVFDKNGFYIEDN